jgi:biopolymer transport protein ExbD
MKVDLPKGSSVVSLAVPKTKVISINNTGQVFIDAIPVNLAELEAKLRDAKAITPDLPIVIKGDRQAQYEKIMNVLDVCGRVGITSLGLAAQRTPGA